MSDRPTCMHCGKPSRPVTGRVIFGEDSKQAGDLFYACMPCDAFAEMNQKNRKPKGRPANPELRNAQRHIITLIYDLARQALASPAYKDSPKTDSVRDAIMFSAKHRCVIYYSYHSELIGDDKLMPGFLTLAQCRDVWRILKREKYDDIRAWFKAYEES